MYAENAIIIFAKYPEKGKVKTRLAKDTGNEFAESFYRICAEHTFKECSKTNPAETDLFLFYKSAAEENNIKNWVSGRFNFYLQNGNDLGEKMFSAFNEIFNKNYKKVLIIGTDAPGISKSILENALNLLSNYAYVIGPSNDGGYYLLGLKQLNENLFKNINWSTSSVFDDTIKKIKDENYYILNELIDIDTKNDILKYLKNNASSNKEVDKFLIENYGN